MGYRDPAMLYNDLPILIFILNAQLNGDQENHLIRIEILLSQLLTQGTHTYMKDSRKLLFYG